MAETDNMSEVNIAKSLKIVLSEMASAVSRRSSNLPKIEPRLVCVSKTKPSSLVIEAYEAGQKHFGENYAGELNDKSNCETIIDKCKDIKWHFIGHLQSGNVKKVLTSPGLFIIETIHSEKLASKINQQWPEYSNNSNKLLNVMVQINTSGEDAKSGVQPGEAVNLVKFIQENCPNLSLMGLMTIGQIGFDCSAGPNPDFVTLAKCREDVCAALNLNISDMELSMGMSSDFQHAIELGSTNVRVGSNVFGGR